MITLMLFMGYEMYGVEPGNQPAPSNVRVAPSDWATFAYILAIAVVREPAVGQEQLWYT